MPDFVLNTIFKYSRDNCLNTFYKLSRQYAIHEAFENPGEGWKQMDIEEKTNPEKFKKYKHFSIRYYKNTPDYIRIMLNYEIQYNPEYGKKENQRPFIWVYKNASLLFVIWHNYIQPLYAIKLKNVCDLLQKPDGSPLNQKSLQSHGYDYGIEKDSIPFNIRKRLENFYNS